jgi:hypothetical protein
MIIELGTESAKMKADLALISNGVKKALMR